MPLPWGKMKSSKISRFVYDIRCSKRGESLVVQPGFPTSLIDLFVKNRNCLNNSKTKKRKSRSGSVDEEIESTINCDTPVIIPPSTPIGPFILNSINALLIGESESESSSEEDDCCVVEEIETRVEENGELKKNDNRVGNKVFIFVIFIFILAFSPKKVAIATTFFGFIFVFIGFLFNLCINKRERERSEEIDVDLEKEKCLTSSNLVALIKEIEIEFDSKGVGEMELDSGKFEEVCQEYDCDKKREILEDIEEIVVENEKVGIPRRRSSAKLNAKKFKKFVAKKFGGETKNRRRNKEGKVDISNVQSNCDTEKEIVITGGIMGEQEKDVEEDDENDDDDDEEAERNVVDDGCDSVHVSDVSSDMGVQESLGRPKKWSWGPFVLVVIILAGLVSGRLMAIVLSIVWVPLMNQQKLLKAIQRYRG